MATDLQVRSAQATMATGQLRSVFQPIVDLRSGRIVGHEALARGPVGSEMEMPGALFGSADAAGILTEFDRACRAVALDTAVSSGLFEHGLLFLNAEPAGLSPEGVLDPSVEPRLAEISVVVELTERALTSRPSEVLAAVTWLRERGCRIALDDVGVDPRSLGLMPFLSPDLIKLDLRLTQSLEAEADTAHVIHAVRAEAERSGALILAEGIETEEHRRRAVAMGARLGQGFLFGRPGELDARTAAGAVTEGPPLKIPRRPSLEPYDNTPFERVGDPDETLIGEKRLLLALSRQLEEESRAQRGEAVLLATFQDKGFFSDRVRRRYERLARRSALVGALGVGMDAEPGEGLRGAALRPEDNLCEEWDVVVVSPHFAGALIARDLGDDVADLDRRFEYQLTYDRDRVAEAARPLLHRLIRAT